MPSLDQGLASYLKSESLKVDIAPGGIAWGTRGTDFELMTPIDGRSDAVTEGGRIADFMGSPHVRDTVLVAGNRRDLLGRVVRITGDRLGYDASGKVALVVGVQETGAGTTSLSVVRKLS